MLCGIVPVYNLVAGPNHTEWETNKALAMQRFDSCFFVADLYEAWALYQFGMLTLEQVNISLNRKNPRRRSSSEQDNQLQELLTSHAAVAQLMWLGVFLFIIVCLLQAGYALVQMLGF